MIQVFSDGIYAADTDSLSISRVDRSCTFIPTDDSVIDHMPMQMKFKEIRPDGTTRIVQGIGVLTYKISSTNLHQFWFKKLQIVTTEVYQ